MATLSLKKNIQDNEINGLSNIPLNNDNHCAYDDDHDEELEFEDANENHSSNSDSGHSSQMTNSDILENSVHSSQSSDDDLDLNLTNVKIDEISIDDHNNHQDDDEPPSLDESLDDIVRLLDMAMDNCYHEAYEGTQKWSHCSLYHALGKGTLSFLKGCLTLERPEIEKALEDLRNSMDVCQKEKRHSMTRYMWRPNYNTFTDVEIHAELCYAETLLLTALLTFLEDQNLLNLVRGAFRIRACFQSYKECFYILNNRTEWSSESSRRHFESGVRMGIGTFNLLFSHMPSKVLKLLEFVGFSGNRQKGLEELSASVFLENGLRRPLAALIMLVYQCYFEHIFGLGDFDMDCVDRCLDYGLTKHPNGAFFLLFLGRKKQLTGQVKEAISAFDRCISAQNEWKQFHNICYWELLWCYAIQCDWINAANCADILRKQCKWSPGAYTYQYATFLYMIMIEQDKPELKSEITSLMKKVPELRIRFAGKTIPAEKFATIQAQKYFDQNERLVLPSIEFMYIWNIFAVIGKSPHLLNPILERVEKNEKIEEEKLMKSKSNCNDDDDDNDENVSIDDYCRCLLLKGMCLRHFQKNDESNECFLKVIECKDKIKTDKYLIPHATLELALNYMKCGQFTESRKWLDSAKTYSGYALETIVHFRIHTALRTMNMQSKRQRQQKQSSSSSSSSLSSSQEQSSCDSNNNDHDSINNDNNSNRKSHGSIRSIWNELSRRFTFSDKSEDLDDDDDGDVNGNDIIDDNELQNSKTSTKF